MNIANFVESKNNRNTNSTEKVWKSMLNLCSYAREDVALSINVLKVG